MTLRVPFIPQRWTLVTAIAATPVACGGPLMEASVSTLEAAPRATSPAKTARIQHLAKGRNAYMGRLEIEAGARVPLHRDTTEEFIHVLEGGGRVTIDGTSYPINAGMTVYMPANAEVSFDNGATKTVALQVFAGPSPAQKYDAWTPLP